MASSGSLQEDEIFTRPVFKISVHLIKKQIQGLEVLASRGN